jgi:hypothetical protein
MTSFMLFKICLWKVFALHFSSSVTLHLGKFDISVNVKNSLTDKVSIIFLDIKCYIDVIWLINYKKTVRRLFCN